MSVQPSFTIDLEKFKPDPKTIEKERHANRVASSWVAAIAVGPIIGTLTGMLLRSNFNIGKAGATAAGIATMLTTGALAAWAGDTLGKNAKTNEEERSEMLMDAAKSGNFTEALKKQMAAREENALLLGLVAGQHR